LASQKNPETQKRANQRELVWDDFEGSELREHQSLCAKNLFSLEINHICAELMQKKPISNAF
jgi:hypothetical protein